MDLGSLVAQFGVDSSQLQKLQGELNSVDRQSASAFGNMSGHASSAMSSMAGLVGVTLSFAGAIALAHSALSNWYSIISSGIMKVEEFKKEMISTSYLLAAQSKVDKPDLGKAYAAWGDYYKWMKEAALEADKAAASGMEDIMAVATQLLKKGVKAKDLEEFNVIARLTDVMKGAIPGMASLAMQARGEVTAILEGIVRPGSQTAIVLAGIDSEFKKNMASARAAGKELEYFSNLLPKINQYTLDMMGTLDAVTSSLKAAYSVVQIKAFGDAHKDIVKFIGDLGNKIVENGKLTQTGEKFALALGEAWAQAKVSISSAVDYMLNNLPKIVSDISNLATALGKVASAAASAVPQIVKLIGKLTELATNPLTYAVLGAGAGMIAAGPLGAGVGFTAGLVGAAAIKTQSVINTTAPSTLSAPEVQKNALGAANQEIMARYGINPKALEGIKTGVAALWTPDLRPPTGKEGKGGGGKGGGAEAAEKSVRSFIETMTQATAQGAGDTEAILAAWKSKQLKTLAELAAKGADVADARAALEDAYASKRRKLDDDFNKWYISGLGNQQAVLKAEEEEKLKTVAGNESKMAQVKEVYRKKNADLDYQVQTNTANLFKGYLDTMAGLAPTLEGQLRLKRESLGLELKLAKAALERQIAEKQINPELADQARLMEAMVAQAKKYNLEMENDKGVKGWAYGRSKEIDQRNPVKDVMGSIESRMGETIGSSIVDSLQGKQKDLKELFKNVMGEAISWVYKFNAQTLMDSLAGMMGDGGTSGLGFSTSKKQLALDKKIDVTELKNLNLEAKSFKGFDMEVRDFGKATEQYGKFSVAVQSYYAKFSSHINTAFPQLTEASQGLSTTVAPMTGAAGEMTTSSVASTMSSVAQVGAAGGMALSAIGMLTSSKELSMAGMVISTAASLLQIAAIIMATSESIPFFHSGGMITAHAGWPPKKPGEVDIRALRGERVLSIEENKNYETRMRAGSRPSEDGRGERSSIVYSPTYHINAIDARGIDAVLAKHGKTMTKVINREVGRRGRKL